MLTLLSGIKGELLIQKVEYFPDLSWKMSVHIFPAT